MSLIGYKIFGLLPGQEEGLRFQSCVRGLEKKPYLWADECPYPIPHDATPVVTCVLEEEMQTSEATV